MKRVLLMSILILFLVGCASTQATTRRAQYLSDGYNEQIQKNITVFSLIDARPDKERDTRKLLSNKVTISDQILKPLKAKGYKALFKDVDTLSCGSLSGINDIQQMPCLNKEIFENGDLFLLVSIDKYVPPKGMSINGETKVSGVLYSKNLDSFIWRDSIEGIYDSVNTAMFGLGGYAGKIILKSMGNDLTFRSNALGSIRELLNSMPPFPAKQNR